MSVLLGTPHTATVRAFTDCEVYEYQNAEAFMSSDPAITFAIARLLAQRLNSATTYLVDLKRQYAGSGNHLGMVSSVLASLINQPDRDYDPGSDREPDHRM
jgi:CRP-like cAMP-binding protein